MEELTQRQTRARQEPEDKQRNERARERQELEDKQRIELAEFTEKLAARSVVVPGRALLAATSEKTGRPSHTVAP